VPRAVILFFVFAPCRGADAARVALASILNTFTLIWLLTYITNVSIIVEFLIALSARRRDDYAL